MISTFTAFFDANVFFGARLRSLILFQAQTGLFRARWSDDVHREWMNAVISKRPDLTIQDLEKTRNDMDASVLDCLVTGYEPLIPGMALPDENDRHVLAAAVAGKASVIVTFNLKHFSDENLRPFGLHAKHPDDFLLDLESIDSDAFLEAVIEDIAHYRRPLSVDKYLEDLERANVPKTAGLLRKLKVLLASGD